MFSSVRKNRYNTIRINKLANGGKNFEFSELFG